MTEFYKSIKFIILFPRIPEETFFSLEELELPLFLPSQMH